jgi:predicted nucleotidyltransferase
MPRVEEERRPASRQLTRSEIEAAARELARRFPDVLAVWLFGSYARGEERRTSDLDLAVMTRPELASSRSYQEELRSAVEEGLGEPADVVLRHAALPLPLLWEVLSSPRLLFARDSEDAHAFASTLRALVREDWPRMERCWNRAAQWIREKQRAPSE